MNFTSVHASSRMFSSQGKIKFFDPHFHLVDWENEKGPHKENTELWKTLYPEKPIFVIKDYEALILGEDDPVELIGGVFVEANATPERRLDEAKWVDKELDKSSLPYGLVAGIDLQQDIHEVIAFNKTQKRWRGYRNILNYDEGAEVNMDPAVTSNRFLEQKVKDNFKVMEDAGASFEFMLNPHQY